MQEIGARGEKILVLVRLRPLNEKEITANELADWECINHTTILYRNSLREGLTFPSDYSFVFCGDNTTRQLYDEGIRELALSVVNGINSSVFAYGKTNSGKTYTMCGITDYVVSDIFDYIQKYEERAFALKFSAIEIYNEVVRDLLSTDNALLRLLNDPKRGTIVEKLREETVRDQSHFNQLVAIGEAQRQIGEDNGSLSELSGVTNGSYYEETKKRSTFERPSHLHWQNECSMTEMTEDTSSPPSIGHKYFRPDPNSSLEEITNGEASYGYCKNVRSIYMEGGNDSGILASSPDESGVSSLSPAADGVAIGRDFLLDPVLDDQEENHAQNFSHCGALEQRLNHAQKTIDSLVPPDVDNMSPEDLGDYSGETIKATPAYELGSSFTGPHEGLNKNFPLLSNDAGTVQLSRNNSQSSLESGSIARSVGATPDEDEGIPSINAFVSGLREMADAYGNQLSGDQMVEPISGSNEKNGKEVSSDPHTGSLGFCFRLSTGISEATTEDNRTLA